MVAAFSLLISSCSISKEIRAQRNLISGTWNLDSITYENSEGKFSSVLFTDADATCFEGSNWFFRDNNSTGRYTLKSSDDCASGNRTIRWSVQEVPGGSQLQFKFLNEQYKDVSGGVGFRLNIAVLNEQQMTLNSYASVEGENIKVVYNFTKK